MIEGDALRIPNLHARGCQSLADRRKYPTRASADTDEFAPDEDEFITAVSRFRSVNQISTPTLCQLLWVLKKLGYRK